MGCTLPSKSFKPSSQIRACGLETTETWQAHIHSPRQKLTQLTGGFNKKKKLFGSLEKNFLRLLCVKENPSQETWTPSTLTHLGRGEGFLGGPLTGLKGPFFSGRDLQSWFCSHHEVYYCQYITPRYSSSLPVAVTCKSFLFTLFLLAGVNEMLAIGGGAFSSAPTNPCSFESLRCKVACAGRSHLYFYLFFC